MVAKDPLIGPTGHRNPKQFTLGHTNAHFILRSDVVIVPRGGYRDPLDVNESPITSTQNNRAIVGLQVNVLVGTPHDLFPVHSSPFGAFKRQDSSLHFQLAVNRTGDAIGEDIFSVERVGTSERVKLGRVRREYDSSVLVPDVKRLEPPKTSSVLVDS